MADNIINKLRGQGIRQAHLPGLETHYASSPFHKEKDFDYLGRAEEVSSLLNTHIPGGDIAAANVNDAVFFEMADAQGYGLEESKRAVQGMKQAGFMVYDLETLGSSPYALQGSGETFDFFEAPQIALHRHRYDPSNLVGGRPQLVSDPPLVLAMQISQNTHNKLGGLIGEIERDPNTWMTLDEKTRRSLVDLTLYQDEANFYKEVIEGGQEMKLLKGQSKTKPNHNSLGATTSQNLAAMRQGLSNLSNPELTNSYDHAARFLDTYLQDGMRMAGQNNTHFDKPAMQYLFRDYAGQSVGQKIAAAEFDLLPTTRAITRNRTDFTAKNYQLEELYNFFLPNDPQLQAHFSGADTTMTGKLIDAVLWSDEGKALFANSATTNVERRIAAQAEQTFVATQGLGRYFPSSYSRDKNRFSMSMRFDPKKGSWLPANGYQESALTQGRRYKFLGMQDGFQMPGAEHEGITYYSMFFEDEKSGLFSTVIDSDRNRLLSIFQDGHLKRPDELAPGQEDFLRYDSKRRTYEQLFNPRMRYEADSARSRIEDAYKIIATYSEQLEAPELKGNPQAHELALGRTYEKLNEHLVGKDSIYRKSFSRVQNIVEMQDVLLDEKPYWDKTLQGARSLSKGSSNWASIQQENIYIKQMFDSYSNSLAEAFPDQNRKVGHSGMGLFGIRSSLAGEITYLDISSPTKHTESLNSFLRTNSSESTGMKLSRLEAYLRGVEEQVGSRTTQEMRVMAQEDITRNGYVSNATIAKISARTHHHLIESPKTLNGLNVSPTSARLALNGLDHTKGYASSLVSKSSHFFDEVSQQATQQAMSQLNSQALNGSIKLSGAILERAEKSEHILEGFFRDAYGAKSIYNFQTGEVEKGLSNQLHKPVSYAEEISKTWKTLEQNQFDSSILFDPSTNQGFILAAPRELGVNLANVNRQNLYTDKRIMKLPLPFIDDNFGIDAGVGAIAHEFSLEITGTGKHQAEAHLKSSVSGIFEDMRSGIHQTRKNLTEAGQFTTGRRPAELVEAGEAAIRGRITQNAVFVSFGQNIDRSMAQPVASRQKARNEAFRVKLSPVVEHYLEINRPGVFSDWENWRDENNYHGDIMGANEFWYAQKKGLRNDVYSSAYFYGQDVIGSQNGLSFTLSGITGAQHSQSYAYLRDLRSATPLGYYNSATRDQITKTPNYLAMERGPLQEYIESRHQPQSETERRIAERAARRRLVPSAKIGEEDLMGNALSETNRQVMGIDIRAAYTNDRELLKKNRRVKEELATQIKDLETEWQFASDARKRVIDIRLQELNRYHDMVEGLSVHEGQSLIRESLAQSIQHESVREIRLGKEEALPEQLRGLLADELGVPREELYPGMSMGLEGRTHRLKHGISYADMTEAGYGLLDKDGLLTVGNLVDMEVTEGDFDEFLEKTGSRKRISKHATITGITERDGQLSLILSENRIFDDTSKGLGGWGDGKYTFHAIPDDLMDRLYGGATDMIAENSKISKSNFGAILTSFIQTSHTNVLDELDRLAAGLPAGRILSPDDTNLGALKQYFKTNQVTVSDLMKEEIRGNISMTSMNPILDAMGLSDSVQYNARFDKLLFDDVGYKPEMIGATGHRNFQKAYAYGTEQLNFNEGHVLFELRHHNASRHSGTATKPRETHRNRMLEAMQETIYGDSAYASHIRDLRKSTATGAHEQYAARIMDALRLETKGELDHAAVRQKGNVILDMTGEWASAGGANIRLDEETGAYIVDGLSFNRMPKGPNADYRNTMADPMSLRLLNKEAGIDTTMGALLDEQEGMAFLRTQTDEQKLFSKTYVPVIGQMDDHLTPWERESNLRAVGKSFAEAADAVAEVQTMTVTSADVSREEIQAHADRYSKRFETELTNYREHRNYYMSSAQPGAFIKNSQGGMAQNGFNTRFQGYNAALELEGNFRAEEFFVSPKLASDSIRGIEHNILLANGMSEGAIEAIGDSKAMNDYIVQNLMGTAGEEGLQVYGIGSRQPLQGMGNLSALSMRVDANIKEGAYLSRAAEAAMKADNDGDDFNFLLDAYQGITGRKTDFQSIQADLEKRTQMLGRYQEKAEYDFIESAFSGLANASEKEVDQYFRYFNTKLEDGQNMAVLDQKIRGIGQGDNRLVAIREMTQSVLQASLKEGVIDPAEYARTTYSLDETTDMYMQRLIAAKKVTADALNIDADQLQAMDAAGQSSYVKQQADSFIDTKDRIMELFSNPRTAHTDEFVQLSLKNKIIEEEEADFFADFYTKVATMNESVEEAGYRGMYNESFKLGRSSGDKQGAFYKMLLDPTSRGDLLHTTTSGNAALSVLTDPADIAHWQELHERQQKTLAYSFGRRREQLLNGVQESFSDTAASQLESLSNLAKHNGRFRHMDQAGSILNSLKANAGQIVDSSAFKAGAGFAAMWVMGSAIKNAPTPEGNEAQQEASMVEVAPGALLTSPTARVTPKGENVQLVISGSGNVDQNMLAGIINEQVAAQTGVPMQMNIQTTDNTTQLDKSFYEQAITNILGI